jgi:hypothetical protein
MIFGLATSAQASLAVGQEVPLISSLQGPVLQVLMPLAAAQPPIHKANRRADTPRG